jgi:hypothetical protein
VLHPSLGYLLTGNYTDYLLFVKRNLPIGKRTLLLAFESSVEGRGCPALKRMAQDSPDLDPQTLPKDRFNTSGGEARESRGRRRLLKKEKGRTASSRAVSVTSFIWSGWLERFR